MVQILHGKRIAAGAILQPSTSAVIFDQDKKVLLTRRADNGQWCLPGGHMDAGESAAECCIREVREETGLEVEIVRLVGIYTNPDMIGVYQDGNRKQFVSMCFEAQMIGGGLTVSEESVDLGYFSLDEMRTLDMFEHHMERIIDGLAGVEAAFIR